MKYKILACALALSVLGIEKTPLQATTQNRALTVEEFVASFSGDDQIKIARLLQEVDLEEVAFLEIHPFAAARFLKISANLCFPEVTSRLLYEKVIIKHPELIAQLTHLLFEKIAEQEFIRRHVSTEGNTLVWDPS